MSVFVRQQHSICSFTDSNSWVILSPIEQSIKNKIEAVGTPLKDWDINIYRGVLTGCNDAFIITTEKRDDILFNCKDEAERKRTEDLIRPILRGRDIKRYGYNWAGLWLIATFPAKHYNIDDYPAVKKYLLSYAREYLSSNGYVWVAEEYLSDFCKQKLSQAGKIISINSKHITIGHKVEKSRKKTSNKWFETQDSISYWEDFSKPKIVYMEIQTDNPKEGYPFPCFSFDNNKMIVLNTAYILSSDIINPKYILGVLNSSLGKFLVKLYVTQLQEKQFRMLAQYVNKMPIPKPTHEQENKISKYVDLVLSHHGDAEKLIDREVYDIFNLTDEEKDFIAVKSHL